MKVIFFDVDGTLTETQSGATFKENPEDIKVMDGVTKGLDFHRSKGYVMIGISNQGGCAAINQSTGKPHKSIEDTTITEMRNTLQLLPQLELIYFCPDFEGLTAWQIFRDNALEIKQNDISELGSFRKPGAGMINHFLQNKAIEEAWLIGDRPEDDGAASSAGIEFIWADTWRQRFAPGIHEFRPTNMKQIGLLEGIKL
ncbi:hypothetical protein DSM106972_095540 [Dulcicalothrix desertica PCC 7102]|uniref:D,D-heptose 1,7-bisphosphate phosphatase n=1 Tax=Dulcicalothrix desertica PCC 7102 TaxID=232991 RepID=A0A3S1BYK8_9CYAN|nr:HAD hydrolase-like protein [Dulcicalothrix desertica]RUS93795.1 hypothetical protein DSM106972_095540 [Dulcicalothrix desertica PCC 7102]TWH62726.1 D-glycero-D-manno-heptose 1,7-bisphosphate phosphatase [Dulcicalothrix desertica PCC 7102]